MKALVNNAPGHLELLEVPLPEPGPGKVRIRTYACGICATDLDMIAGWDRTLFPSIPGHEWVGHVDAVGKWVDESLIGQPCVAENVLSDGGEVGFEHPGGYGEYLLTEADKLQVLPQEFPLHQGVLIEPLAVCVRGLKRLAGAKDRLGNVSFGGPVLILGDGPIGLLLAAVLRLGGTTGITLMGGRSSRLALATEVGATQTMEYHRLADAEPQTVARELNQEFPLVIEASGSPKAAEVALCAAAPNGQVLILGDYGTGCAQFPWNGLLHRELHILGSNASAGAWPEAVQIAISGDLPLKKLITHHFSPDQATEALQTVKNRDAGTVKAVFDWQKPAGRP